jgi:ammonia channel protein AmtB
VSTQTAADLLAQPSHDTFLTVAAAAAAAAPKPHSNLTAAGRRWGAFFGGDGKLLAAQIIALLVTILWVCLFFFPYFWLMRRFSLIRVPMEQELAGLDASKYGVITTNELPTMPKPRQKMYV